MTLLTDVHPTGIGPQREPGMLSAGAPMAVYPKVYDIEIDPKDLQVGALFGWNAGPVVEVVEKYLESVKSIRIHLRRRSHDLVAVEIRVGFCHLFDPKRPMC